MQTTQQLGLRKDGSKFPVELIIVNVKSDTEDFFTCIIRDISAKKEMETLRSRLVSIIESTDDAIFSKDLSGHVTTWNKGSEKVTGYTAEEMIGHYAGDLLTPEYRKEADRMVELARAGRKIRHFETTITHKAGHIINVSLSVSPIFDNYGKVEAISVIARDISDRKRVEEQLRLSEEKYRVVVNNIKEVVFRTDELGNWIFLNPAWTTITGYTAEESYNRMFLEFVHPDDREYSLQFFLSVIRGEKDYYTYEMRYSSHSGNYWWTEVTLRVMKDSSGNITGTTGTLRDITLKREAELSIKEKNEALQRMNEELQKRIEERRYFETELERSYAELEKRVQERTRELSLSEKRFRLLGDMIPHIVWTTDPDGSVDYYNKKLDEYSGFNFDEVAGKVWEKLIHPDDIERTNEAWKAALVSGDVYEIEYRLKRWDGQYRWFLTRALPLRDENEMIVKWFGSATDIHDQKLLDEKKDEFIGIASHELKTPLTSIKAYMQLLERLVEEDPRLKNYVNKTNGFVDKLNNLVSELLDVSKIQAGKLQFSMMKIDVPSLIRESVESVQHSTVTHKIMIEGDLPSKTIMGDKMRLEQVLINFLTNAVKYSPQADKVIVSAWEEEDKVTIAVKDFGLGITPENRKRIFDRFYRAEGLSPHISGLGIGLYIASEIVRRHHGKVWLESEQGKGSVFYFCLPVVE